MGTPLMPWQEQVALVGGELDTSTGLPAYREVIVTVPRQAGKTLLMLAWQVQRATGWDRLGPQRIAYSAQTGNDARKKLIEDQVPILEPRSHTLGIRRILRGMGNESVEFTNGSRIVLLASAADSGHGKTIDLGIKDEFFADYDDRRDQAMIPAMATRKAAQVVTISTMGTDESVPLDRAVERGRAAVAAGARAGLAYFEWSADPASDMDDPATWWGFHPALGHTITEAVIAHARATLTDGEFRRAFANLKTRADDRVIPGDAWAAVCSPTAQPTEPLTFAIDVNPERSAGAIVAAGGGVAEVIPRLADGTGDDGFPTAGTAWLVPRAVQLDERWGGPVWVVDSKGPARTLIPAMVEAGLNVHAATSDEVVSACGQFYDGVLDRRYRLRQNAALDEAAAGAAKRQVGDAWAWTRKNATADISPLVAATLALWGAGRPAEDQPSAYEERGLVTL
jgi:hypothetical protein